MADRMPLTDNENLNKVRKQESNEASQPQQADVSRIQRAIDNPSSETLTPDVVQSLQSSHGNQFVNRLIQRMGSSPTSPLKFPVQAKMTVTPANDTYEKEADAVAASVVQKMQSPDIQRAEGEEEEMMMKRIQREEGGEEEEMMMKRIQREEGGEEEEMQMKRIQRAEVDEDGGDISSGLESEIESARGGGQSLPDNVAQKMGDAMGADLSGVKVHTDNKADELNSAVQARAFTTGNDIFMKKGEYNPGTKSGQELLAHELTHTVQQGAVPMQKKEED
ncbi:MAG: DUF4157 domain-containing protein [Chloroflexota bacterium]